MMNELHTPAVMRDADDPMGRRWLVEIGKVFGALFDGEPLPERGRLVLGDAPGFGMEPADRGALVPWTS